MSTDKYCVVTYTAAGILTCHWAWACVVLGLGSALFHIAAGTSTLNNPALVRASASSNPSGARIGHYSCQ